MNESEMRAHIIVGAIPPSTEAGRLWHEQWHSSGEHPEAPKDCGSAGCGFLGRILAVEAESRDARDEEWLEKWEASIADRVRDDLAMVLSQIEARVAEPQCGWEAEHIAAIREEAAR